MSSSQMIRNIRYALHFLPDEMYIQLNFSARFKRFANLTNSKSFNEKLQWLKLYDRKPEYTKMVDKYEVKRHVSDLIGEEYIIPTLGVWDRFEDIDFDSLPNQFVLKCTHDSGGLVICRDKSEFDKKAAKKKIEKSLRRNYFYVGREWPYKDVIPRIIAEQLMVDRKDLDLKDYKVFCFGGSPKIIQVDIDRFSEHKRNMYNTIWQKQDFEYCYSASKEEIEEPYNLSGMLRLAEILSIGMAFVRVDFYEVNKKLFFGEITFYPESGFGKFNPTEWNYKLGEWINLPEKKSNG